MSSNIHDSKVTLFILKEDKDLYAFSDDKKIVIEFMCTREMDNFIVKEKRMEAEEYVTFCHYNSGKILNTDYLYDGTHTFEFPMTIDESSKLDLEIDEIYQRVGDSEIFKYMKIFKGKYKKSLKKVFDYASSFYHNGDTEFNSFNVFIKLFNFTMMKIERLEDNEFY